VVDEVALRRGLDPPFECHFEDGDARFGRQARPWFEDLSAAQRLGDRSGERVELHHLAFLKVSVGADERVALSGEIAARLQDRGRGLQRGRDHLERCGTPGSLRDGIHHQRL
jgi:hypothetical protein